MYRILIASNGYYYVQKQRSTSMWRKIGGFFHTKSSGERFISDLRFLPDGRVVGYY